MRARAKKKGNQARIKEFPDSVSVREAIRKGNATVRLSCLVMGAGNLRYGQYVKGILFLAAEVVYILFMSLFGAGALAGLTTLGIQTTQEVFNETKQIYEYVQGDNSMLFLLYGVAVIFITIGFFIIWRTNVKSAYAQQKRKEQGKPVLRLREDLKSLLDNRLNVTLLFFPTLCVVMFTILPLVFMICMAFTNYDRNHQPPGQLFDWVGLVNFEKILDTGSGLGYAFWHILGWTFIWAVAATFLNYILGMILAMVINWKETRLKSFWRFIFVLSIAVPQFVSLLIMRTMLQPEGAVNVLLRNMGLIAQDASLPFFTDPTWARVTVIVVNIWVGVPYTLLQLTGVLQNIPAELYEAAKVDGANSLQIFTKITLPYMLYVTTPYLIVTFTGNVNNFNVIYLLSGGDPVTDLSSTAGKTDLLVTWLYKLTIDKQYYNIGAVIGILTFIILAVAALLTYRNTKSYKEEGGF